EACPRLADRGREAGRRPLHRHARREARRHRSPAGRTRGLGREPGPRDGGHDHVAAGLRVHAEGHPFDRRDGEPRHRRRRRRRRRMMPEGIYAAASGMAAQQAQMDAISNDIANVNTAGYKSERIGFRDLVYSAEHGAPVGAGAATVDLGRTSAAGELQQNGDPLSVAILGPGYLQVRKADGSLALTRNGDLTLDAEGGIVTQTGERL